MPTPSKEELTERAQLVRIHEANCGIEFPSEQERNFRFAVMKKLGEQLGLKELKNATFTSPASQGGKGAKP
jgi:hypothetical protein